MIVNDGKLWLNTERRKQSVVSTQNPAQALPSGLHGRSEIEIEIEIKSTREEGWRNIGTNE